MHSQLVREMETSLVNLDLVEELLGWEQCWLKSQWGLGGSVG